MAGAWRAGAANREGGADVLGPIGLGGGALGMEGLVGAVEPPPERCAIRSPCSASPCGGSPLSARTASLLAIAAQGTSATAKPMAAATQQTQRTRDMQNPPPLGPAHDR